MRLQLTILDGSLANRSQEFVLAEGGEVRLGRDPAHCQLCFSADYPHVSRQHCALRAVLGRVRLTTNKANAVLVADQPVWNDTLVADGAVLRLGAEGPRVAVAIHATESSELAPTVGRAAIAGCAEELLERQTHTIAVRLDSQRRRTRYAGAGIGAVALLGAWFAWEASAEVRLLRSAVLDDSQRAFVRELMLRHATPTPGLAEVAARVAPSVYCVMRRTDQGAESVGTGWVVDDRAGLVATNAHVAEAFRPGAMFLRENGGAAADLDVEAVRLHPAYAEFGAQLVRFCQALEVSGIDSSGRAMRGCDVALLVVAGPHRSRLAPALPILGVDEAAALAPGAPCATIGYPSEGVGFHPDRPQRKVHLGHVVAVTDYFMAAAPANDAQLVHTSMPVAGGASGSPVVDDQGRVLGLISSANMVFTAEGRRIPLAGTTYAQRIDTLVELLGRGVEHAARAESWQRNFAAAVANAKKSLEQALTDRFREHLGARGLRDEVHVLTREPVRLEWDAQAGMTVQSVAFEAPAAGHYLCCIIADDVEDIGASVFLPDGRRLRAHSADWFPRIAFGASAGGTVRVAAFRDGNRPTAALVLVLHAAP